MARRTAGRQQIQIPKALPHQDPILKSKARFKLLRCGRRWGKSRLKFRAAVTGHGPGRMYKGAAQGGTIIWLAPDYPQSKAIWEEEIKPRFENVRGVKLDNSERTVLLPNRGRLELRSAEAVDSIRGRKLDGVLCDEAAFYGPGGRELMYAWRRVIRPTLTDLGGWAIFGSTTDVGSDFNELAREVEDGKREGWEAWHGRSRDNPKLSKEELDLLYAEYPPGGSDMLQELEAELLDSHGTLFREEFFRFKYKQANRHAMWLPSGERLPFVEIVFYVDLASSIKQTADYFWVTVVGLTGWPRRAGVLHMFYDHLEGPDQLTKLQEMVGEWQPQRVHIEAVQYQATMVQHMKAKVPRHISVEPVYPDKDKRSRAVPVAAAMSRGEVWWPEHAVWLLDIIKQARRFPNGKEQSRDLADHDDGVDTLSMLGLDLLPEEAGDWRVRKVVR